MGDSEADAARYAPDTFVVQPATPEITEIGNRPEVKHAALNELHRLHKNCVVHHFTEEDEVAHVTNWTVIEYAEEPTPYGPNYFMKVSIAEGHNILLRAHKQEHHNVWNFHSLHKTFVGDEETVRCGPAEGSERPS